MLGRTSLLFCVWVSLLAVSVGQRAEQLLAQNPCSSKTTCSDCVRTPACAWCFAHDFNGPRCFNPSVEGGTAGCDEASVFNPDNQQSIDPMYYRELTRGQTGIGIESSYYEKSMSSSSVKGGAYGASAAGGENFVQITPQRVKLQLRTNERHRISFSYAQAQDYPVDLYYLMDLRKSMNDHKKKLSTLGRQLSNTMRNITSNFRIGFGSFGDKIVSLKSPCDGCAPYSFKNRMPLSSDTDFFDKAVADAEVSGNLDAPEGGLNDAIMQAVVCKSEIGWREHARKLLVISTDAGFHYAGDGKLGDIVQPNDGQCHMAGNSYTYSTTSDYPSISQINLKVKEHAINVIFAVTAEQIGVYEQLSKHIEGSSSGVLSDDSDNVVDLVRDQYNKITSTVQMKDTSSNALQISYYSSCLGHKDNVVQTNRCDGLKVSDVVKFNAEITLKECPKEPSKWKQSFTIYPVGVSESLNVEVEMLCDCPCEHPGHHAYDDRPEACSGHGISACGACVCNPGSFGKRCECAGYGDVSLDPERDCRPTSVRQNRGR